MIKIVFGKDKFGSNIQVGLELEDLVMIFMNYNSIG